MTLPALDGPGPAPVVQQAPPFGPSGATRLPCRVRLPTRRQHKGHRAYGGQAPAPAAGGDLRRTGHFGMASELLAFQGLRELAGSLVPGQPLETTGDVARLITKLHDAIEVFCRCFIPSAPGIRPVHVLDGSAAGSDAAQRQSVAQLRRGRDGKQPGRSRDGAARLARSSRSTHRRRSKESLPT